MRIRASAALFPQYIVTNHEICERVYSQSLGLRGADRTRTVGMVERYLDELGANRRRWLAGSEKPIHLIQQAFSIALERANLGPEEIDTLIYCAVDRPLLEPASAALVASELGLASVRAFDISHACAGWFTALQVAGDGADRRGETTIIISAEFPMTTGGVAYPQNFDLSDAAEVRRKLATLVLGEAACATVVAPGGGPLRYQQRNDNDGYGASYVKLPQAERFASRPGTMFCTPDLTFCSNPLGLTKHGRDIGYDAFDALAIDPTANAVIIPHTISTRLVTSLRERCSPSFSIVDIFPEVGNIGTASLAAGLAHCQRTLPQATPRIGWMLAAGMSAVAFEFPLTG